MLHRMLTLSAAIVGALTLPAQAEDRCMVSQPLPRSEAASPYDNPEMYAETTRPFRKFITFITESADSGKEDDKACVVENLQRWAAEDALLSKPLNFEGARQRIRYTTALNISALKVGINQRENGDIVLWLRKLSLAVADEFAPRRIQKGSSDNLYVWSGVAAATFLLIANDDKLLAYQNAVWKDALASVRPDGSIYLETLREQRSTPYHLYYLGAVEWLKYLRSALHLQTQDGSSIGRLQGYIGGKLCGPKEDAFGPTSTISAEYVRPTDPAYWNALRNCGIKDTSFVVPSFGGDMRSTLMIIGKKGGGRSP